MDYRNPLIELYNDQHLYQQSLLIEKNVYDEGLNITQWGNLSVQTDNHVEDILVFLLDIILLHHKNCLIQY